MAILTIQFQMSLVQAQAGHGVIKAGIRKGGVTGRTVLLQDGHGLSPRMTGIAPQISMWTTKRPPGQIMTESGVGFGLMTEFAVTILDVMTALAGVMFFPEMDMGR